MAIKFKEIKKYISRVARISICFRDGHYDNYSLLSDIPDGKYDDLYVYGIGIEDYPDTESSLIKYGIFDSYDLKQMTLVLSKEPK